MTDTTPDVWLGICQTCGACKQFGNPHNLDLWMTHHPHERDDNDDK